MFATLEASSVGDNLRVVAVRGSEALCRPYEFQVYFTQATGEPVDIPSAINTAGKLVLGSGELKHDVCGLLAGIRLIAQTSEWALYQALLVPKLWHLGLTKHSRVFTKMTVPDIIEEVLESAGFTSSDYELRLSGEYKEEELIVQYHESKLKFIQRWMEHEGISYFFEHADGADKMILVDDRSAHAALASEAVRYRPTLETDVSSGLCFDVFQAHYNTTVKSVKLADYDYSRPLFDLSAEEDVSDRGIGAMTLHRARFWDPSDAKRYAKIRAEELKAQELVFHASGTVLHMGAGYLFDVREHPGDDYNVTYLATEVVHFVNQLAEAGSEALAKVVPCEFKDRYRVQVTAIDHKLQYRPPRTTRRPRVWGYENGVVDGEADSPYAQIDDQGRYRVKFKFDESDLDKGKASTYVRMMQPHGGTTEGFHFPLRKGTEVIFTFQGGDPDRPVIAGVVPNMTTQSPVTEKNHTQNVLRTGSNNHFVLDDAEGAEFISLKTPKDNTGVYFGNPVPKRMSSFDGDGEPTIVLPPISFHAYTDGSTFFDFQGSWHIETGALKEEMINGTVTETYKGHHKTTVTTGGREEDITGLQKETYGDSQETWVFGSQLNVVSTTLDEQVTGKVTETYGEQETTVNGWRHIIAKASETHDVTGWYTCTASSGVHLEAPAVHLKATSDGMFDGGPKLVLKATEITINGTAKVEIVTPELKKTDPNKFSFGNIQETLMTDLKFFTSVSTGITGLKLEATGGKLDVHAFHIQNDGYAVWTRGPKADTAGPDSELKGLKAIIAGITTFT